MYSGFVKFFHIQTHIGTKTKKNCWTSLFLRPTFIKISFSFQHDQSFLITLPGSLERRWVLLLRHCVQVDVHELVQRQERGRRFSELVESFPQSTFMNLDNLDDVRDTPVEVVQTTGDQECCSTKAWNFFVLSLESLTSLSLCFLKFQY